MTTEAEIITSTDAVDESTAEIGRESGAVVPVPHREPGDPLAAAAQFVKDHPYLTVACGLAIGAIAASFLPRGTGRRLARRAVTLAEAASAASLLLGKTAMTRAESTGHELRGYGNAAGEQISRFGGMAASRVQGMVGSVGSAASSAGNRIAERAAELKDRVRH